MRKQRAADNSPPGLRWGPFTLRIPLVHTRVEWPELLQGLFVAGATALGLVPLLTTYFGLTFEEAIACIFIQSLLISSAPILFGDPYAPGWLTPALPLALSFVLASEPAVGDAYGTPGERFRIMTALSLDFAALVFVLGISGLGRRLVEWIPAALKGGIIMGAAIGALKRVFLDDAELLLLRQPVTTITAAAVCLVLTYSAPLEYLKTRYRPIALFAGLGLLPGFLLAAAVGTLPGIDEIQYDVQWGILIPPFADLFRKASPMGIGWPSWEMFFNGLPLAAMGYVILFGDLITGNEVIRAAAALRTDETVDLNIQRTHYSVAIRNVAMALFAPFFPTQGCLWTGVHVIIVQRWKLGTRAMSSLFSGIHSYYLFGIPLLLLLLPVLTALKPLMGIALSLTLVLTGFACAYIAMGLVRTQTEQGVVLLTAVTLTFFSPWIGMVVGVLATLLLVGVGGEGRGRPTGRRNESDGVRTGDHDD